MLIGFFQLRTAGGMFFAMMGLRKTVPSRMERIVPFGLFHACLSLYSFHPCRVRRDGRALDAHAMLDDGIRRVDRHGIIGLVPMLDARS